MRVPNCDNVSSQNYNSNESKIITKMTSKIVDTLSRKAEPEEDLMRRCAPAVVSISHMDEDLNEIETKGSGFVSCIALLCIPKFKLV